MVKQPRYETVTLEKIVGGGQALGTLSDGRKCFVWGGLPDETVTFRVTKKKAHFVEGSVTEVLHASPERIAPRDADSYLSTSPWQIMTFSAEQRYKAALIEEAFKLHAIVLPHKINVYTDGREFQYRNKVEFSWFSERAGESHPDTLDLAFFRRGSKGKIIVNECSLLPPEIIALAHSIRDILRRKHISARQLKTLLVRSNQQGSCVWQLYIKDRLPNIITHEEAEMLPAQGGEVIYSDPRSPASRATARLAKFGDTTLTDTILGTPFRYACEGFFQVNIPMYEQALRDMREWTSCPKRTTPANSDTDGENPPVIDLYAGVGTIGLTVGGDNVTLIEINEFAVAEMQRNITALGRTNARAILAPSEKALDFITPNHVVIVDPPRAGLHANVVAKLLEVAPPRIIYLSCNPVTQARDAALLTEKYNIRAHRGYNFFPHTPHIEHLVVLDRK